MEENVMYIINKDKWNNLWIVGIAEVEKGEKGENFSHYLEWKGDSWANSRG